MNTQMYKNLLEKQLSEFEMLQSIFYNPGEIHVDDYSIIADITDFINDKSETVPQCLDFKINFTVEELNFELYVTLAHEYPDVKPDLFVRTNRQDRDQQRKLNTDLAKYVNSLEEGDICIYSAITWLQENVMGYVNQDENPAKRTDPEQAETEYARYWIYSHHIYSKTKRREILSLADDYCLTGFCLPGKPGIICIEGPATSCNTWWMYIKSMNWKKIVCKKIETQLCDDVSSFTYFKKFQEVALQCEGNRSNHVNMKQFHKFLEEHNCIYIFNELFGF